MKTQNIAHSKVKNAGILFELLVRQITVDALEGKTSSPAIKLMQSYFRPTTELGKELQLYRAFFEMKQLDEAKAIKFIDLIAEQRRKLNEEKLAKEKYELVKELKNIYDLKEFLSVKIPSYKIYASIYKTFLAEQRNFDVTSIKEVAIAKFSLVEHLVKDHRVPKKPVSEGDIIEMFKNQETVDRLMSYKVLLDRFNSKYSNLNSRQKNLLREFINSVSNSDSFANYVRSEIDPLKKELTEAAKTEVNPVVKIKLTEVVAQLENIKSRIKIRDNELTAMMIAYQIAEELKVK